MVTYMAVNQKNRPTKMRHVRFFQLLPDIERPGAAPLCIAKAVFCEVPVQRNRKLMFDTELLDV